MTCFVTVGTTLFDNLINEVLTDESIENLKNIGIQKIILQIGRGNFNLNIIEKIFKQDTSNEGTAKYNNIQIEYYRFKPSLADDMNNAMIIIGHAGAGTCLEVLKLEKPFIVVINEQLMDNHQAELAIALSEGFHLLYCTTSSLSSTISNPGLFTLLPYVPISQKCVAQFIDRRMGITNKIS